MTRLRSRLAGALAVPLVLTACGTVSSAASGLQEDAAAANAALAGAEGLGVVLRFDDPDGDLVRALQDGRGGLSAELADIVVGGRVELRIAATGGRTLADQPEPGVPLAEQLRWADSALTVSTADADLLSWRTVDGVLFVASDLAEVERVAAASGSPLSLRDEVAGAPAPVVEVHDALRAGQAVAVPFADLLEGLGELAGTGQETVPERLPDGLLDDLRAAIEPHARLTDLGRDDGVRRVTVEVDLRRMLEAVTQAAAGSLPEADDLTFGSLGDGTVTGTLTIEDGHYRRLDLPLAELADLAETTDVPLPDLGDSALVVELDDEVRTIEAPNRVAELDLLELLGSDAGPSAPADEALLACFEQAETEEQLEACAEPA